MKTLLIIVIGVLITVCIIILAKKAWNAYIQKMKDRNIQGQIDEWESLRSEGYYN